MMEIEIPDREALAPLALHGGIESPPPSEGIGDDGNINTLGAHMKRKGPLFRHDVVVSVLCRT